MKKNLLVMLALSVSLLFSGVASAEHDASHMKMDAIQKPVVAKTPSPIEVKPGQLILEVDGLVCAVCGYGIERNVAKLDFIDRKKFSHGVLTDVYNQRLVLALVPGKSVDLKALSEAIKHAGYPLKAVYLFSAEGHPTRIEAADIR